MFDFLKKIFAKKQETPVIEEPAEPIEIAKLSEWLDQRIEKYYADMKEALAASLNRISHLRDELEKAVDTFGLARIREEDKVVDPKIKNIVLGHRQNYIRMLKNSLLSMEIPKNPELKEMLEFCDRISGIMNEIGTITAKSHFASQHLFSENVKELSDLLREIDKEVQQIRDYILSRKINEAESVKDKSAKLFEQHRRKSEIVHALDGFKKSLSEMQEQQSKCLNEIERLKHNPDYEALIQRQEELKLAEYGITRSKKRMVDMVSPIESALRKYAKLSLQDEKFIQSYAENPVKMLIDDRELKIAGVLQSMKASINSGSLELKDEKKDKTLSALNSLSKEGFESLVGEYTINLNKKNSILQELARSPILEMRRKAELGAAEAESKSEQYKVEAEKMVKLLAEQDLSAAIAELEQAVFSMLTVKIKIVA